LFVLFVFSVAAAAAQDHSTYPAARRADQVDVFHGVTVVDPYRWLEDSDSPETRAWIEAQNRISSAYLEAVPGREALRRRLTELWDYERYSTPVARAGRYFFTLNDGLQNQAVLYVADGLAGAPRAILDPNTFSTDGTVALTQWVPSEDASLLAYGTSSGGSDWEEWRVREVATGRDLPDRLQWVKFSAAAWTHDGRGFFYSRYDAPAAGEALAAANYHQKLYYHRLGTPQTEDELIYRRPDQKEWGFQGEVTDDGRHLVIQVWKGTETENGVLYKDLTTPGAPVVELLTAFDATYLFLGNDGPVFWFQTDLDAPRGRLIAIDTRAPERARWREVVPEGEDTVQSARVVGDSFLVHYLHHARSRVGRFDLAGRPLGELALPGLGTAGGMTGRRADRETFFSFTGYTTPATIYRVDLTRGVGTVEVFRQPKVAFDPAGYETRQVFFTSKDGTRVPMFITHKQGLARDGRNPTFLYGYGGFNISVTPSFSVQNLVWMERGGALAVPNLRGGGEYGEAWHEAGSKLRKQNVFDDAYAAAEWLIANRYTTRERLAIGGRSNGGLLAAAAVSQRPDLFGAAVVAVGVLDMLRFHKFTIGWGWVSDYGSPDDPQEFAALRAYSPYHNLKPGTAYPATLVTTADHDDRVVPGHSFKFAAALQHAQAGPAPVLARIETRAGHGAGKPTSKKIDEATDELSFLVRALGVVVGAKKMTTAGSPN
jgi:prolyl oligopeptidase